MRGLIFDPFAGISGDMVLGALVDLGLEPDWLRGVAASLGVDGIEVDVERVDRRGLSCARVSFRLPHQHAHRHLSDVLRIVEQSPLPAVAKAKASAAFRLLAQAEARVHGVTVEDVHFHEVGALDSILDVLCAMGGVERLGFEAFFTRPVELGSGWIEAEHGRLPVPAPATLGLLEGLPVREAGLAGECTTPTGAAILAALVDGRRLPGEYTVGRSGYGAGSRDPEDRPNCLRVVACEVEPEPQRLLVLQADIDDLPPEYLPPAQEALLAAGALDAVALPLGMKKARPGLRLEALVPEAALESVLAALFEATPTIGARYWPVSRPALPRTEETIEWRGQRVRRKRVRLPDGAERTKPEYDDVVLAARRLGMAPYRVRLALAADDGPPDAPAD